MLTLPGGFASDRYDGSSVFRDSLLKLTARLKADSARPAPINEIWLRPRAALGEKVA